jgi:pimeloyl-ACP methyl ester carboxylesterase
VRERFDVITWDLRGLGESTAVKRCASRADEDRFLAGVGKPAVTPPVGPLEMSRWIQRYRAFGQRSRQRSGNLTLYIPTAESARDMDLLRRAVGARQVTFIGGSYGTFLGATYANMLPRSVRAMALSAGHRSRGVGEARPRRGIQMPRVCRRFTGVKATRPRLWPKRRRAAVRVARKGRGTLPLSSRMQQSCVDEDDAWELEQSLGLGSREILVVGVVEAVPLAVAVEEVRARIIVVL